MRHARNAAKVDELEGKTFNRWTILSVEKGTHTTHARCVCRCACGKVMRRVLQSIVMGTSKSCGCFRNEKTLERSTKHGLHGTPEYVCWQAMKQRCYDKSASNYKWYGGKGVVVCDRWLKSFELFLSDMGKKPTPAHTVDRINPFLEYSPDNCRWATPKEQAQNKRENYGA